MSSGTESAVSGRRLAAKARELGFALCGTTSAAPSGHMALYERWVAEGHHGAMAYLAREDSLARRSDLRGTMEDVRSVVVVGHEYYSEDDPDPTQESTRAIVARYARGDDYHEVVKEKLVELLAWLDAEVPGGVRGRAYVDTGPILERELAQRAGLGWFGKNTMLIHPGHGSYFFLGVLLVDRELASSPPFDDDRCGTCSACLDACPTGALLGRGEDGSPVMDARRCISYLTIELRGPIPRELRSGIGNRVFGCDICQEVCPWNTRFARETTEPRYAVRAGLSAPTLADLAEELLDLDEAGFRARFRGSPIRRARRRGLVRNVCVAMGNHLKRGGHDPAALRMLGLLARALEDADPLVQGHAAWALGCHGSEQSRARLRSRLQLPLDDFVREEVEAALGGEESGR